MGEASRKRRQKGERGNETRQRSKKKRGGVGRARKELERDVGKLRVYRG